MQAYSNTGAVKVPLDRWDRDMPDQAFTIRSAFAKRLADIKAGHVAGR